MAKLVCPDVNFLAASKDPPQERRQKSYIPSNTGQSSIPKLYLDKNFSKLVTLFGDILFLIL